MKIEWTVPNVDEFIAKSSEVQGSLTDHTKVMARKATAILAQHRLQGHSYIETETYGRGIERLVVLNDTRGLRAAMSIEEGTRRSVGVYALARAAGQKIRSGRRYVKHGPGRR